MSLDERIVVVTGGAMGIGRAIADGFNAKGTSIARSGYDSRPDPLLADFPKQ